MGKPEGVIEKHLVKRCNENGFLCRKYVSPGYKGVPDRIVIARGHTVFIELKSAVGKLSELQKREIKRMLLSGADVRVYNNKEQIDAFIDEALGWKVKKYKIPPDMVELLGKDDDK